MMNKSIARPGLLIAVVAVICAGHARAQDAQSLNRSGDAAQVATTNVTVIPRAADSLPPLDKHRDEPEVATGAAGEKGDAPDEAGGPARAKPSPRIVEGGGEPNASQSAPDDGWQFQLTPYIWFSGLEGTVGARGLTTEVDASFADIIDELNIGVMGAFEARRGRLLLPTDMQYIRLTDNKGTPGPLFSGAEVEVKQFMLEPKIGYRALEGRAGHVDLLAGIRYWHLSTDTILSAGLAPGRSVSASKNWVDPIIGTRLHLNLSPKIFVAGKADLGGFGAGSDTTWQLLIAGGYNISPRYSLLTGYRYLSVNYRKDGFIYDVNMKGLVSGLAIRF